MTVMMMMRMGMMVMTWCFQSRPAICYPPRVAPSLIFQACAPEWDGDGDNRDVPRAEGSGALLKPIKQTNCSSAAGVQSPRLSALICGNDERGVGSERGEKF